MTTLDRYIGLIYIKVLLISFASLAGLYVMIEGSANGQELASYAKTQSGGMVWVAAEYFGPRLLLFFEFTAGIIASLAAVLTVSWLQRTNEYTAIVAAGIRPSRVIRVLCVFTVGVAVLAAVNREVWLPAVRSQLAYNAQDLEGSRGRPCTPTFDPQTDVLLAAKAVFPKRQRLLEPSFGLNSPALAAWGRKLQAEEALYRPAAGELPAGYLLRGVKHPANLATLATVRVNERPVLLGPRDTPGLAPDECFVASVVTFEQLALGSTYRRYLSTPELVAALHDRRLQSGADVLMTLHKRLVQPILDITVVFLALPLVLLRGSRTMIWAGSRGALLTAGLFIAALACQSLGMNYLLRPTLAVWLPLLVFAPVSYALARPIWD